MYSHLLDMTRDSREHTMEENDSYIIEFVRCSVYGLQNVLVVYVKQ